jgi:hypothetical protein
MNPKITWKYHPLRDEPVSKTLLLGTISFAVCGCAYLSFGHVVYPLITFCVLGCSLNRYFFPTSFELTETHIRISSPFHGTKSTSWDSCEKVVFFKNGMHVQTAGTRRSRKHAQERYVPLCGHAEEVKPLLSRLVRTQQKEGAHPLSLVIDGERQEALAGEGNPPI